MATHSAYYRLSDPHRQIRASPVAVDIEEREFFEDFAHRFWYSTCTTYKISACWLRTSLSQALAWLRD